MNYFMRRRQAWEDSKQQTKKSRRFCETKFLRVRIVNQTVAIQSKRVWERTREEYMDAKWNSIIDNPAVRIAMVIVGFGVWFAVSYGLLAA